MNTLALDTSGASESVALLQNGHPTAEVFLESPSSHSETLLASIDQVLKTAKLTLAEIDLFALTVGPGSFTGLRIGISTVKAFSKIFSKPVAPVSTLLAMAEPFLSSGKVVVSCLDARLGEIFVAAYQRDSDSKILTLLPPIPLSIERLREELEKISQDKLILGPVVVVDSENFLNISSSTLVLDSNAHLVKAEAVGRLGEAMQKNGETLKGSQLKAHYLRVSEAEHRLLLKQVS